MKRAIVIVDAQNDFFPPNGALAVPNADKIRTNLAKITEMAKDDNILLIKTMDCHDTNDPEFKVFPPHCVAETTGQASILECAANKAVVFNKKTYDVFHPELGSKEIDEWLKKNKVTEVFVAGLVGNICVEAAVMGLLRRGIKVYVFENATVWMELEKGIFCEGADNKELSVKRMKKAGVYFAVAKL